MSEFGPARTYSNLTATDELRKLLDERGVEWWNETDPEPQSITMARADEQLIEYHENANGSTGYHIFNMHDLTPEQAITATLGAGECTLESAHGYCDPYVRTAYQIELSCHTLDAWDDPVPPSYCPYCGKRVVKEDA